MKNTYSDQIKFKNICPSIIYWVVGQKRPKSNENFALFCHNFWTDWAIIYGPPVIYIGRYQINRGRLLGLAKSTKNKEN